MSHKLTLPKMEITEFGIEVFNADTTIQPLKFPEGKTMEAVFKDPRTPILAFTGALWKEIRYCVEKNPNQELAMFLCIKRMHTRKPHFLAFDMFMPKQSITGSSVRMDGESCQAYYEALKDHEYFKEYGLHRNLCHLHSHGSFSCFWSGTDDTEQFSMDELGFYDDYRLYVVVNAKGDVKASLVNYFPTLYRVDCATALFFSREEYARDLTPMRKKELDAIMAENMERYVPPIASARTVSYVGSPWTRHGMIYDPKPITQVAVTSTADNAEGDSWQKQETNHYIHFAKPSYQTVLDCIKLCASSFEEHVERISDYAQSTDFDDFGVDEYGFDTKEYQDVVSAAGHLIQLFKSSIKNNERALDMEDIQALGSYIKYVALLSENAQAITTFGLSSTFMDRMNSETCWMIHDETLNACSENLLVHEPAELGEIMVADLNTYILDLEPVNPDAEFTDIAPELLCGAF